MVVHPIGCNAVSASQGRPLSLLEIVLVLGVVTCLDGVVSDSPTIA